MQLFSRKKTFALLSLSALVALGACGDDVTVPPPVVVPPTVTITPPSANMNVGESLNFAVQISGGSTTTPPTLASCTSSNTAVATAAVTGSACRVTAVAAGNATVTAAASTGQVAAASITVNAPQAAINTLTISPTTSNIAVGQSVTIVPTVNKAATAVAVTYAYTSSSTAIATVNATTGVVTAVAPGVATITITATGSGTGYSTATLTGAATVTVAALPQGITTLNVQPTQLAIALGSTAQISASAQQPTGAAAAVITYGTTVPSVATVSTTGLVTGVAPGTAVITVTATSAANANFAASTVTQLVPVTVSPSANVTIQTITQGPIVTSYVNDIQGSAQQAGILSANNAQVNQPIDVTNVRDQIQVVANLNPNGQRVDSVVVFIANADGSNRRAAARQLYSNGTANAGDITLFVNTADFTVNFAAGTSDVFYPNGQKLISVSVFTTEGTVAKEVQNAVNNRQTVNFNNVDGYAAQYTNPTRTANNPANGLNWWGGPGAEGTGSATIVPVFYTAGRQITNLTLGMRQGLTLTTAICDQAGQATPTRSGQGVSTESYTAAPFKATYNAEVGRMVAGTGSTSSFTTAGNGNIECLGYEHPAADQQNIMGVIAATDNQNNGGPLVTFANGYRFSTSVARPVANRLDYNAPSTTTPDLRRASPSVTGWVNATFNFQSNTDASTDAGVGTPGARTWYYKGAGSATSPACTDTNWVAMPNATGADIPECASNLIGGWDGVNGTTRSGSPYRALYTEADRLQNVRTSAGSDVFGVDKTVPLIRFSTASRADTAIVTATSATTTFQAEFIDERAGFIDGTELSGTATFAAPTKSSTGTIGTLASTVRAQAHVASRAGGFNTNVTSTKAICINPNALTTALLATNGSTLNAGTTFLTAPNCATVTPTTAVNIGQTGDGYRIGHPAQLESQEGLYHYLTFARDRAGNVTETIRRRVAVEASSPTIADVLMPATVSATAAPVIGYNAQDNVEIRATTLANTYTGLPSSNILRYPQTLVDARFNDNVNSPVAGAQASVTVPAPYVFGVATTFGGTPTTVQTAQLQIWNVANNSAISASSGYISQGIPALNSFNTGTGGGYNSWSVMPSTDAGFNAPTGLKAQLVSGTNVTNQAFVRVDFFRLSAATADFGASHWQYLGSANTAATADVGTLGTDRAFTFTLPDAQYAKRPNALETTQSPVQTGDVILAIGVRANGAGLATTGTIGGQAIQINVTGLPAGAAANLTITNGSGYTQAVTGSGIYTVPSAGTYFVTGQNTTFNNQTYGISTITPGTVNVVANAVAGPVNVTYVNATTSLNINVTGIVGGGTYGFTISGPNGFTQVVTQGNGNVTYTVPGAGTYTVTANNAGTNQAIGSYTHTVPAAAGGLVVAQAPAVAPTAAQAFTNLTNHLQFSVSGLPTGFSLPASAGCGIGAMQNGTNLRQVGANVNCTLTGDVFYNAADTTFYTTTFANPYAATTGAVATNHNIVYTANGAQITINTSTFGGGANNLPNGIPFTVRLTSSNYASTGGFRDFAGVTGTPLNIRVSAGTFNVSISRNLVVGNQTWNIDDPTAPAEVTFGAGNATGTAVRQISGNNAVVQNVIISGTPTVVTDLQANITFRFTGPIATP